MERGSSREYLPASANINMGGRPNVPFFIHIEATNNHLYCKIIMRVIISGKGVLQGSTILDPSTKKARCHRFSRVPYALPPVGGRRWQRPQPLPTHYQYGTETLPGLYTKPCSICPQLRMPQSTTSEDCLQSNIYVPLGAPPRDGWPVFFYIRECISVLWYVY
jgi:hypothetical protein